MKESSFEGVGGLKIFTRAWQPEDAPRGVVVIVHGFNSHSGQYFWVGEQFAKNGLAVYALDLPGRGRSEGERYYVEKIEGGKSWLARIFVRTQRGRRNGLHLHARSSNGN
jgi:acylglycerol lipase